MSPAGWSAKDSPTSSARRAHHGAMRKRVVLLLAGALMVAGCTSALQESLSTAPNETTSAQQAAGGAVIAVKIDNVDDARPATGLGSAEAIYVEPVEGGLTRIVAIFGTRRPSAIGPVRSARETDLDLLQQFGRPTFAYSGSVPQIQPLLNATPSINASQANVPKAYYRSSSRAAPHNLYLDPTKLPIGGPPAQPVFTFGPAPSGGTPATDEKVGYKSASYEFRFVGGKWLVWMDGTQFRSSEAGQLGAATVVLQKVATHPEPFAEDSSGAVAPVAQTVGTGTATVLIGAHAYAATWSRPTESAPTVFSVDGQPLPFANGQIWVMLIPA